MLLNLARNNAWKLPLLALVWLTFIVVSFVYLVNQRLLPFDPDGQLTNLQSSDIKAISVNDGALKLTEHKRTVIHFTSKDCQCNWAASEHQPLIDNLATNLDFAVKYISLDSSDTLPSSPALAVIDDHGELMFLGPYSVGLACSAESGFIETVLKNYQQGFNSKLIVSDAQGCYCTL